MPIRLGVQVVAQYYRRLCNASDLTSHEQRRGKMLESTYYLPRMLSDNNVRLLTSAGTVDHIVLIPSPGNRTINLEDNL